MATPGIRNVTTARGALGSALLEKDDSGGEVIRFILSALWALLCFLASALAALVTWIVAEIREWAASMERRGQSALAVALQATAVVALVVLCCCCCGYYAAGGRRRRRGPDGEEAFGGHDGPVVRYGCRGRDRGRYGGGIFSMHPNKPIR